MTETAWQKSSFSSGDPNTNCVEVAAESHVLYLRESQDPNVVISPDRATLRGLVNHLKASVQTGD